MPKYYDISLDMLKTHNITGRKTTLQKSLHFLSPAASIVPWTCNRSACPNASGTGGSGCGGWELEASLRAAKKEKPKSSEHS